MMFHYRIEQMRYEWWVVSKDRWYFEGCSHPERLGRLEFPTLLWRQWTRPLANHLLEGKKMLGNGLATFFPSVVFWNVYHGQMQLMRTRAHKRVM